MTQLHFLVVDDDDDSRQTIVEYLKTLGYQRVSKARNGSEALIQLQKEPGINFIISDWDMPGMNGLALLREVRKDPDRKSIPFLIATSPISHEAEKVMLAAESLIDGYIIKPFRMQVLEEKLQKLIHTASAESGKQVVIVDDDEDARATVQEYVVQLGFQDTKAFSDAKAALKYLETHWGRVQLIISDWEMPHMNGIEFLKTCKQTPGLSDVPFLMITSQGSMERMKVMQAAKAQVDDYLLKPFQGGELRKRIADLMSRKKVREEAAPSLDAGLAALAEGNFTRAAECLEAAANLDGNNDQTLCALGDALSRTKGTDAALPYYKRAIDANPFNIDAYLKLAQGYEGVGLTDKALALLQGAIQQLGFSAEIHFMLGKLFHKKGMLSSAREEFEKTLEIDPAHAGATQQLQKEKP